MKAKREMKGRLRGILDRRWEIRIQNRNKTSVNPYNWIKCLPEKENKLRSQTRNKLTCVSLATDMIFQY